MSTDGFWSDQCGRRLPGLTHVHDRECEDGHLGDQCCECGMRATMWTPTPVVRLVADEPVAGRVEPGTAPYAAYADTTPDDEGAPREPKLAWRIYPSQWRHDWGRMPWGESDEERLLFFLAVRDAHLGE